MSARFSGRPRARLTTGDFEGPGKKKGKKRKGKKPYASTEARVKKLKPPVPSSGAPESGHRRAPDGHEYELKLEQGSDLIQPTCTCGWSGAPSVRREALASYRRHIAEIGDGSDATESPSAPSQPQVDGTTVGPDARPPKAAVGRTATSRDNGTEPTFVDDWIDRFRGESNRVSAHVVEYPGSEPDEVLSFEFGPALHVPNSDLVASLNDAIGIENRDVSIKLNEFRWGASQAAIEIVVAVAAGVGANALWHWMRTIEASHQPAAPELSLDAAIAHVRSEIAHQFGDRSADEQVLAEERRGPNEWMIVVLKGSHRYEATVISSLTGVVSRIRRVRATTAGTAQP